jgi:hypothetical protein
MPAIFNSLILVLSKTSQLAKSWCAALVCRWRDYLKRREEKRRIRKLIREFGEWLDIIAARAGARGIKIPWNRKERLYFCFKMGVNPNTVSMTSLYLAITSERPIRDFFKPKKAEF